MVMVMVIAINGWFTVQYTENISKSEHENGALNLLSQSVTGLHSCWFAWFFSSGPKLLHLLHVFLFWHQYMALYCTCKRVKWRHFSIWQWAINFRLIRRLCLHLLNAYIAVSSLLWYPWFFLYPCCPKPYTTPTPTPHRTKHEEKPRPITFHRTFYVKLCGHVINTYIKYII